MPLTPNKIRNENDENNENNENSSNSAWWYTGLITAAVATVGGVLLLENTKIKRNMKKHEKECENHFIDCHHIQPEEGDLIEYKRGCYGHWALYVGRGYVIHLIDDINGKARVVKECIKRVANGTLCRVNNLEKAALRLGLSARCKDEIIRFANQQIGKIFDYHLKDKNCEHFATLCRYGADFSQQQRALEGNPIVGTLGPLLARISPSSAHTIGKSVNYSN